MFSWIVTEKNLAVPHKHKFGIPLKHNVSYICYFNISAYSSHQKYISKSLYYQSSQNMFWFKNKYIFNYILIMVDFLAVRNILLIASTSRYDQMLVILPNNTVNFVLSNRKNKYVEDVSTHSTKANGVHNQSVRFSPK